MIESFSLFSLVIISIKSITKSFTLDFIFGVVLIQIMNQNFAHILILLLIVIKVELLLLQYYEAINFSQAVSIRLEAAWSLN